MLQTQELLSLHPTAIDSLIYAIQLDPKKADKELKELKADKEPQGRIRAILGYINAPGTATSEGKGIVLSPRMGNLADIVKREANIVYTPDVTFTGRKNEKPAIEYAPHLVSKPELKLLEIKEFPDAEKLYKLLIREREWITGTLRDFYVEFGNEQREFLYSGNSVDVHVFDITQASRKMNLSPSTMSRLRKGRYVAVKSETHEQERIYSVSDLMPNDNDYFRILTIDRINKIFNEEGNTLSGLTDDEIASKMSASRRTVTKYRTESQIPNSRERTQVYMSNQLSRYYIPPFLNPKNQ